MKHRKRLLILGDIFGMIIALLVFVFPFIFMFLNSVKDRKEANLLTASIPQVFHWENYAEVFKTNDYDAMLDDFEKYVSQNRLVVRDTWFVIGLPLAIYMLEEYMKDVNFFDRLEKFNIDINEKGIWECLKIININNMEDLINKIKLSTNSYIKTLIKIKQKT